MRIIYLHQYFNTPKMSGGTRSYEMARRLVANGHEVHMITSWREDTDETDWFETQESGIQVYWLPVKYSNDMSFSKRTIAFLRFSIKAMRKAASIQSDVIFATSTPLTIALPAVYAKKKQKVPMVFEVRDLWPELPIAMGALKNPILKFFAKKLEKFAYHHSSRIVALSPGMKDGVVKTGYPEDLVAVIPNSSDLDLFDVNSFIGEAFRQSRAWLDDKPLLLYTGSFGIINGVEYLVSLAKELLILSPEIRILLIGGGKEYEKILRLARAGGVLNKNLFIESRLPKNEMPSALSAATMAASVFIDKPEMRANSANKFFDALAAGKPVMINYGGWQKDIIEQSGAGVVTWEMPIKEAAQKVSNFIYDESCMEKARKESKKLAIDRFSRDVLASELQRVLTTAGIKGKVI